MFIFSQTFSSKLPSKMDECEFFDFLKDIEINEYDNNLFKRYKSVDSLSIDLLYKLEEYLIVFQNHKIAPMYLDKKNLGRKGCDSYINEYYKALDTLKKIQDARLYVQKGKGRDILSLLVDFSQLNSKKNGNVKMLISEFRHSFTLEYLYKYLEKRYEEGTGKYKYIPQIVKEQNLLMLSERIEILDKKKYSFYQNYQSSASLIKGFEMSHDNDFFLFSKMNQDRELTGGFKFTLITDNFKWRWLNVLELKRKDKVLTYQTISVLGSGYTPYIRYRNNFDLADSLHNYDRPFSSYLCIERAKHRTWRSGLIRHRGEFQIGAMGISQGRKIQAKLHADVITSSQFVHGWKKQIADGGRMVFQFNHKVDLLLYSNTNRYHTVFKPTFYKLESPKKYNGCNIISEFELKVGTVMTTAGGGFRYSTLDFLKQSGNQMITSKKYKFTEVGWKFDIGINYRYVVHNSLLEGMGLFNTFEKDNYDIVSLDQYVLNSNDIERNIFTFDFGLSLKFRKTTVFFRQYFHNLEYISRLSEVNFQDDRFTSLISSEDKKFYDDNIKKEQTSFLNRKLFGKQIYGYGTFGISWIID